MRRIFLGKEIVHEIEQEDRTTYLLFRPSMVSHTLGTLYLVSLCLNTFDVFTRLFSPCSETLAMQHNIRTYRFSQFFMACVLFFWNQQRIFDTIFTKQPLRMPNYSLEHVHYYFAVVLYEYASNILRANIRTSTQTLVGCK